MTDRRGSRFILEVLFLVALAAGLTLAHLSALEIVGAMALGWVIMAALEWAAWRGEPHYGSGLPPRYYVPRTSLPPAQPLEQVAQSYPEHRDEAPTWIAPPALRAEMLGDWPHAAVAESEPAAEEWPVTREETGDGLEVVEVVPLPPLSVAGPEPEADAETPEPTAKAQVDSVPEPEAAADAEAAEPRSEAEVDSAPAPEQERLPEPAVDVVSTPSVQRVARHSLDPLAEPAPKRRFGRRATDEVPAVEVPARPVGARALPGRPSRQD
jgi:hypothetical protein